MILFALQKTQVPTAGIPRAGQIEMHDKPQRDKSQRDKPWIFRTYAGHSTARDSNELYRKNLAKGQTGLSVAFDLPTQTGYDSDHVLARGEVGKVGVPISHLGDMRALFDGIALGTAIAVLDTVRSSGEVTQEKFGEVVGRISFFVNAGLRFVTEICKMRAFTELWEEITRERYGITDPKQRLFRYGVQVNSLGLTEPQPENNVTRIMIEMLAVTLSKNARARAVQLPAWNEALGLPRPWDQQWSLRMQQILAYETDLLDYGDIFDGSGEVTRKVEELKQQAREELKRIAEMGGAVAAVDTGYLKQQLVESNTARLEAIERGEQVVVGVNKYLESEPSPLAAAADAILTVPKEAERGQIERLKAWRAARDNGAVAAALKDLKH